MEFKDKLRKLRVESGLTQEALADAVHISRSAIAKYENGNGRPSVDTLKAIAFYFGVDEKELESDSTKQKKKRMRILKWSLIGAGSALGAAGLVVLILLLTIPYRSYNYSEEQEKPARITGIIPQVFSKNEQGYELMPNTTFVDYGGNYVPCFKVSSGDVCYVTVSLSTTGYAWLVSLQSDCVSFNHDRCWSITFIEESILTGAITYEVHFEYQLTIEAVIRPMTCTYQSFIETLYFYLE